MLSTINKLLLPKFYKKDITKFSGLDKVLIAYKLWVTKQVLKQ